MDNTFDRQVTLAWKEWAADIGGELCKLSKGQHTSVAQTDNDDTPSCGNPRILFTVTGAKRLRATIKEINLSAAPERRSAQIAYLDELGWRRLNNGTHILEQSIREPRRMAALAGHALRNVWEVMHPAFLNDEMDAPEEPAPSMTPSTADDASELLDPDRLLQVVAEFLSASSGIEVEPSIHRTVPLPDTDGIDSWLQPTIRGVGVECLARLGLIGSPAAIGDIILEYGEQCRDVSLFVDDGYLCAALPIHCPSFQAANFRESLRLWHHFLLFDAKAIRGRIAAAASCAHPTDTAPIPKLLQHITDQCAHDDTYAAPQVAADCELNELLILTFLRTCDRLIVETTERAMNALLVDGDNDEGQRINAEVDGWVLVSTVLRQALRITVMKNREDRKNGVVR